MKIVYSEQRNQHNALVNALRANCITLKLSLKTSPYFLVYEKEAILPPNIYLQTLQVSQESQGKPCLVVQSKINTLLNLEEERQKTKDKFAIHQSHIKHLFDKKYLVNKEFSLGDLVLKWEKPHEEKGKHTKFQSLWIIPHLVHDKIGHHTYRLQSLDEKMDSLPINGQDLKRYFQ